jgi:hypothetical protein
MDLAVDDPRTPERGDIMYSARLVYEVLDARPVESKIWTNRWRLDVRRVGPRTAETVVVPRPGAQAWHTRLYQRGETPADHFGATS